MRSVAAIVCCRLAFTRLSFFAGPYIISSAATNDVNSPVVSRPEAICALPYQRATAMPMPPSTSMSGGRLASAAVTFMFVRNSCQPARANLSPSSRSFPNAFTMRCPVKASTPMCEMLSSASWLRRVVRRTRCPSRTSG